MPPRMRHASEAALLAAGLIFMTAGPLRAVRPPHPPPLHPPPPANRARHGAPASPPSGGLPLAALAAPAVPVGVANANLAIALDLGSGITVTHIQDRVTGHDFLKRPTSLFEFAVNNGTAYQSDTGVQVTSAVPSRDSSTLAITARATSVPLLFQIRLQAAAGEPAVTVDTTVQNTGNAPLFLRMVYPKLHAFVTPGDPARATGMIPQEIGTVIPLQLAPPGAPVAVVKRNDRQEDALVIGREGALWSTFELNDGRWANPLRLTGSGFAPAGAGLAAVVRNSHQEDAFVVGGDGGVWTTWEVSDGGWQGPVRLMPPNLAPPGARLTGLMRNGLQEDLFVVGNDGAVWTTWQNNDSAWFPPVRVTPPNLAPPGAGLTAVRRNDHQEDLFVVGNDGAIWSAFEVNESAWQAPVRLTAPGLAPPGANLAGVMRNAAQEDLFVVGNDGGIWTVWQNNDSAWFGPVRLTGPGVAPAGAALAAVRRNDHQEDLLFTGGDGAVATIWEVNDGAWAGPLAMTGSGLAPPGAAVTGLMRNANQEDVFALGADGAIWTTFEGHDGPWSPGISLAQIIGMPFNIDVGLPNAMNTMEVADVSDAAGGGGLFLASINDTLLHNASPLQFNLSASEVAGFWITDLPGGSQAILPRLAIGVHHSGDWHAAVDYYVQQNQRFWAFPAIPAWFRDQGAIYTFNGGGAGGVYLSIGPQPSLNQRIHSFLELPSLLAEAQSLGTNIVYLWDYWEGAAQGGDPPYWNKGDYIPRADLGGAAALKAGIQAIHQRGGRVILYVEPFIIYQYSNIGMRLGTLWGGRAPDGTLYQQYPGNYTMVAPYRSWQDTIAGICQSFIRDYDADGIFLDSYGWQMNWPIETLAEGRLYSPLEYSRGVLELTDRVRSAVQALKPDAVVLGETTSGQMGQHWHGGISADFAWEREVNHGRILASPVRYGMPEVNYISNGVDMNELHQIYAAGHNLALCGDSFMTVDAASIQHVAALVKVRQQYKDALIYGRQIYQPATGNDAVAAYSYTGAQSHVITVVNSAPVTAYTGALQLDTADAALDWVDALTGETFSVTAGGASRLPVTLPPAGLRVLIGRGAVLE